MGFWIELFGRAAYFLASPAMCSADVRLTVTPSVLTSSKTIV
jgi:hypothetical protein